MYLCFFGVGEGRNKDYDMPEDTCGPSGSDRALGFITMLRTCGEGTVCEKAFISFLVVRASRNPGVLCSCCLLEALDDLMKGAPTDLPVPLPAARNRCAHERRVKCPP